MLNRFKLFVRIIKWANSLKFNVDVEKWGYSIPDGVAATKQKRFSLTGWPEFRIPTPFFCHKTAKQGRKQAKPIHARIYSLFSHCKSQVKAIRIIVCRMFGMVKFVL